MNRTELKPIYNMHIEHLFFEQIKKATAKVSK